MLETVPEYPFAQDAKAVHVPIVLLVAAAVAPAVHMTPSGAVHPDLFDECSSQLK